MKIAVIGVGHMGSWFTRELSKKNEVEVYDKDKLRTHKFRNVKSLSRLSDLQSFEPDILLNAVSLQNTIEVFEEATKFIPEHCVIADITSIKGEIPEYYNECGFPFASMHPMFGPHFTDLNQLKDENVIIISESSEKAKKFFKQYFRSYKINISEYSFSQHDELMAYSLTLPFASSIVFSACVTTSTVPGTTFSRHMRIAQRLLKEEDYLLSEVLFNPHSLKQLEKICTRLEFLKHVIKAKDYEESEKFFNKLRKNLE